MRNSRPIRIAILALMLVVSHVALISHVTAHFQPELDQCELCVSKDQLLKTVSAPQHAIDADSRFDALQLVSRQCAVPVRHARAVHQRGPPAPSP